MRSNKNRLRAPQILWGVAMLTLVFSGCAGSQGATENSALVANPPAEQTPDHSGIVADQTVQSPASDGSLEGTSPSGDADHAAATPAVEETEDTSSASGDSARDKLDDALTAAASGEQDRARTLLKSLTDDKEQAPWALYNLGVLAFEAGNTQKAQDYIQQALKARPGFSPAMVVLVRQDLMAADVQGAEQLVQQQRSLSDNAPGVRTAQLYIDLYKGENQKVMSGTQSVLIDDPTNLSAYYVLAMANLSLGRYQLAKYILRQALDRNDKRADIYFGLGKVAFAQGDDEDARHQWKKALSINPHFPEAKVALTALWLEEMDYTKVVEALKPVVARVPDYVDAWVNYGSGLKGVGDDAGARAAFEKALALDPQCAAAAFNMGILYMDVDDMDDLDRKGRMQKALEWFSKYRSLEGAIAPDDPVNEYEKFAKQEIQMQEELERQAKEDAARAARRKAAEEQKANGEDGGSDQDADEGDDDGWGSDW